MIEFSPAPAALPPGRRVYAIGDIHGCAEQLGHLHAKIAEDLVRRPTASAVIVHIGDYVDRGPDTAGVIQRLVEAIITEYKRAWSGIYPIDPEYQRSEMQPQFANVATPSELVVATSFTLEIGETTGTVHICIPYSTLEPIRDVLYSTIQGDSSEHDRRWVKLLEREIQAAEVELIAELAQAPATVEQLLSFKPGDFIELDLDPRIRATVDGVPVLDCHYGTSNGRYAIKVDRLISNSGLGWLGAGNER